MALAQGNRFMRRQDEAGLASRKAAATPQRRGRPSLEAAAGIDRRVLDAARHCFLEGGFAGTTMDAIAQHAGVTKMTVYQRYADKVSLLRAMMHDRTTSWSVMARQRKVARGETLDQRLRHYARSMLHWSEDEEVKAFGRLIRECEGGARPVAEEMEAIRRDRMLDVLETDMKALSAKEGFVVAGSREIAAIFLGMLTAFPSRSPWLDVGERDRAMARYADKVVDILMKGRAGWQAPE